VLLDLAVLLPSAEGRRVRFAGESRTAVDGPFPEAEQLVAGYWIFQVPSMEEAVEWAKRAPFEALSRNYPGEYGTTGEITVAEQVTEIDGRFTWGPPKTEAGHRTVTLPAVAAAALAEHLSTYSQPGPDGLVFTSAEGGCSAGATSIGACGARPPERWAWRGFASMTCATPRPPCRSRPGRVPGS
jgi:hypothetical protein